MKVVRSKVIGYCFGVANSIDKAGECLEKARRENLPCYSIGSLIHNKDVVGYFASQGMKNLESPEGLEPGVALVRAHGIPDKLRREYIRAGFQVVDSTCPIVAKGADTVRKAAQKGCKTIILGVKGHAEAIGLMGVELPDGRPVRSYLVSCMDDARALMESGELASDDEIIVVVQTTFPVKEFQAIRRYLKTGFSRIRFSNSPCGATEARGKAAVELASQTDAVIVIGGLNSENTNGLARLVSDAGKPVFRIENEKDLDENMIEALRSYSSVGICSGSSTPTTSIRAVEEILEKI
jgi:4-hydroxy-3-methylbut-2-enyl diphosphate reductase